MNRGKRDLPYTCSHFLAKLSSCRLHPEKESKRRRKSRQPKDKSYPLSPCSRGRMSQQAPRTPRLRQNYFCLQKAVLDVMLPCALLRWWGWAKRSQLNAAGCGSKRAFSTPTTKCLQWYPSRDRLESLGWTPLHSLNTVPFLLSPGNFPSNNTPELIVLLQLPNSTP